MATTNLNIRMDTELKSKFKAFCNATGLDMSSAFNMFAKTVVREQRIPFEISAKEDPFFNEYNMKFLKESMEEMEKTGGTVHEVLFDD